ncbi:uncharacterized protein LOC121384985 isoform X2 [Gigantopelta aegis]|nr:uncharacterized protein LOC121384985 isoform X2 [Gigantopelta aegis]XP_041371431.1 uncharacterized protein LOC121384985 isoform X2 [Gigantopelta aegis]
MGYKLTLNTEETVATVTMPGLSVEDFDRDGNPRITSLMHVVVCMRFFANHKPLDKSGRTFCDYAKLTNDSYSFMASVAIETDQGMYDRTVSKWPLSFQFQIGYVGKSSLSSIGTLTAPSTGQKLMHIITQVVYINKATRRPMPLPDWWRGKYANVAISNEPLIVQRTARPADTHVFKVTVMWTDTDNYNHTTWTSYVQFCINAMHDGIKKGFYKNVSKEVVQMGLRKIRMGFTGENLEGDELIVHSWESAEDNTAVCFEIENTDGEVVFHTMLGYPSILARI